MTFAAEFAAQHPDQIAIQDDVSQLTWSEVDDVLNRCANGLNDLDLGPERRIAEV